MDKFEYVEKVNKLEQEAHRLDLEGWINNAWLTWEWWLLFACITVPWIIWIKFANKQKQIESLLFGTLVIICTSLLDEIGVEVGFWRYPIQFLPFTPKAFAFDFSLVPVPYMLMYQYCVRWKSFVITLMIMSIVYAFLGEPIMIWLGIVQYLKWKYIYSFFYYLFLGLSIKWVILKLNET